MGQKRPKIKLTVIDRRGKMGCHRGHRIGQTFDYDTERGELCPMAMHCAFPYIDILRYGGKLPGQPEGVAEFLLRCGHDYGIPGGSRERGRKSTVIKNGEKRK